MSIVAALLERKTALLAVVDTAMAELRAIEVSLAAFKNLNAGKENELNELAQVGLFSKKPKRTSENLTIKQMIVAVLRDTDKSVDANSILYEINSRWKKNIHRTSFSPQLSRLKESGVLIYTDKKWALAENNEASGVLPPEARTGAVLKNTNPDSIKLPLAGSYSEGLPSRKEDEP